MLTMPTTSKPPTIVKTHPPCTPTLGINVVAGSPSFSSMALHDLLLGSWAREGLPPPMAEAHAALVHMVQRVEHQLQEVRWPLPGIHELQKALAEYLIQMYYLGLNLLVCVRSGWMNWLCLLVLVRSSASVMPPI